MGRSGGKVRLRGGVGGGRVGRYGGGRGVKSEGGWIDEES